MKKLMIEVSPQIVGILKPTEGDIADVPAWEHTPREFECLRHPGHTFVVPPAAVTRKPYALRCDLCFRAEHNFAEGYPNIAAYADGWDPSATNRVSAHAKGHPFRCPQCGDRIEQATAGRIWPDRNRVDDPMVLTRACNRCQRRRVADFPGLAAGFVREGGSGETDPEKVFLRGGSWARHKGTTWVCAICGGEHTRSLYSTRMNMREKGIEIPVHKNCQEHV